jgi:hypothetical protein
MKIGVIADTHIPQKTPKIPQKILDDFAGVDMVIHAGDLVEASVLDQLRRVCKDVRAVWGNMDPEEVRTSLPRKDIITVGTHRIGVMHGFGHPLGLARRMLLEFKDDKVDIIVFGHAHRPMNEDRDGILLFNPGSATDSIFAPYKSYGIIEINDSVHARIVKL